MASLAPNRPAMGTRSAGSVPGAPGMGGGGALAEAG
jgi:hypothetical protein